MLRCIEFVFLFVCKFRPLRWDAGGDGPPPLIFGRSVCVFQYFASRVFPWRRVPSWCAFAGRVGETITKAGKKTFARQDARRHAKNVAWGNIRSLARTGARHLLRLATGPSSPRTPPRSRELETSAGVAKFSQEERDEDELNERRGRVAYKESPRHGKEIRAQLVDLLTWPNGALVTKRLGEDGRVYRSERDACKPQPAAHALCQRGPRDRISQAASNSSREPPPPAAADGSYAPLSLVALVGDCPHQRISVFTKVKINSPHAGSCARPRSRRLCELEWGHAIV
ncbi:Kinesin-4 [Olea europaea subsp. europaea]|uniref:Kinesin-4 n=1 Tax=Olea europaea subsp. europaea TaxID=158383 RepID=A0A8S0TM44_OLEEU|nr:Kinesin-4 [Olea europaea subsp. europaea]